MNILFLDQFSEMGGAQRCLADAVDAVVRRGWNACCALPPGGEFGAVLRDRGAAIAEIPCGPYTSGTKGRLDFFRFAAQVPRQVRTLNQLARNSDLIYVNGPRLLPAVSLSRLPRVLFHAHSHIPQTVARRLAVSGVRRSRADVVACSRSVAEPFESVARSIQVIPNGVPELRFRRRDFDGPWRVGVVGRIGPEKGQAEFVEAVRLLQADRPQLRFTICGAPLFGALDYGKRVREAALGLPIEFEGWRQDLDAVYGSLDLLVVPSQLEGMARVVVEAFAAGVPVLAFPTGGIREVVEHSRNGFLTGECTAAALAAAIRAIVATDIGMLHAIVDHARRDWE